MWVCRSVWVGVLVLWIDTILERGASWVCGCVGQILDKEVKFDLMTGQGQGKTITRSAELECSRLKTKKWCNYQFSRRLGRYSFDLMTGQLQKRSLEVLKTIVDSIYLQKLAFWDHKNSTFLLSIQIHENSVQSTNWVISYKWPIFLQMQFILWCPIIG